MRDEAEQLQIAADIGLQVICSQALILNTRTTEAAVETLKALG